VQYERTYSVIPVDAPDLRAMTIFLLWDVDRGDRDTYLQFYETFYPETEVVFAEGLLPEPVWRPATLNPPPGEVD
jgi:hypothetical protein